MNGAERKKERQKKLYKERYRMSFSCELNYLGAAFT
jgi:hypothetical protein